jgi:hypothetical protein
MPARSQPLSHPLASHIWDRLWVGNYYEFSTTLVLEPFPF